MTPQEIENERIAILELEGETLNLRIEELVEAEFNNTACQIQVGDLQGEIQELEGDVQDLQNQINEAQENPEELKRSQSTFTVEGQEYRFKIGFLKFFFRGSVKTAEEVAEDQGMVDELVDIGFGGIEVNPS